MLSSPAVLSLATAVPPHVLEQRDVAAAARTVFAERFGDFDKVEHGVRDGGRDQTPRGEAAGVVSRTPWLGGSNRSLSPVRGRPFRGSAAEGADRDRTRWIGCRRRRHRVVHRDRHPKPRCALARTGSVSGRTWRGSPSSGSAAPQASQGLPWRRASPELRREPLSCSWPWNSAPSRFGPTSSPRPTWSRPRFSPTGRRRRFCGPGRAVSQPSRGAANTSGATRWTSWAGRSTREGFGVVLARALPPFIETQYRTGLCRSDLRASPSLAESVDRFVCHPGGPKIIAALEQALHLGEGALDHEREVLATHGNMSSADGAVRPGAGVAVRPAGPLAPRRDGAGLHAVLPRPGPQPVSAGLLLLAFVTLQRGAELLWARRNARRMIERGAVEVAPRPLPRHGGAARLMAVRSLVAGAGIGRRTRFGPALISHVQVGRFWVLATLRGRWTTRIIVLPDLELVTAGPYRFVDHPNYLVVAAEIALLPLAFGLPAYASPVLDPQCARPHGARSCRECGAAGGVPARRAA